MENQKMIQSMVVLFLTCFTGIQVSNADESQENPQCQNSAVNYNVTLTNGGKSGKFYKLDKVHKIDDCINSCCDNKKCDVAFVVKKTCYMVECYNKQSCGIQQANKLSLGTVLSVVNKPSRISDKGAEPAVDENLAEEATSPFIKDDGMTTISAFGTGKYRRTKRSSDIIDLVVAVGCGTVAVAVGVAGVIMMTRRLIDNSKNSAA